VEVGSATTRPAWIPARARSSGQTRWAPGRERESRLLTGTPGFPEAGVLPEIKLPVGAAGLCPAADGWRLRLDGRGPHWADDRDPGLLNIPALLSVL